MSTSPQALSGLDAAFLALETPSAPMHVTGVVLLDTSDIEPDEFHRRFRETLLSRVADLAPLRRRLAPGPFVADGAAWEQPARLDIDWHLRRANIGGSGDPAALASFVSELTSRPLDRSHPLWEMWLVEGLESGRTALVAKVHHATMDGAGGTELMSRLFDTELRPRAGERRPVRSRGTRPGWWGTPTRAARAAIATPGRVARATVRTAWVGLKLTLDRIRRAPDEAAALPLPGTDTILNGAITNERCMAFTEVPLSSLKRASRRAGATINDVVLTACSHALRSYLDRVDRIPDGALVAAVPKAIDRQEAAGANAVSAMFVHLPVHLADPEAQLRAVQRSARSAKRIHGSMGSSSLVSGWAEATPGVLLDALSSLYSWLDLADHHAPLFNLVVSNVRGPAFPLYCAGAQVEACFPFGPIYEGAGLNVTVLSYDGRLFFGAFGCPRTTPDVDLLTASFEKAVALLGQGRNRRPLPTAGSMPGYP